MNVVTVTADEAGNVVIPSRNPEYAYIRVEQSKVVMSNGWARKVKKNALIKGKTEDLKELGYFKGQKLPGQIVVAESLEPINPDNPQQGIKMAGETGVPCTFEGQPIYRDAFYTENMEATDSVIEHDNVDEIRAAQAKLSEAANLEN